MCRASGRGGLVSGEGLEKPEMRASLDPSLKSVLR